MSLLPWIRNLHRRRWASRLSLLLLAVAALAVLGWRAMRSEVGAPRDALDDPWHEGHRVQDRHGALLRELPTDEGRRGRALPLEEIGNRLVTATLAAEDAEFFEHDGIDRVAIMRAIEQNLRHGRLVSGASTITQQLVKLLDTRGTPGPRTLPIKLEEAARAQNLEERLSKDQILEAYLNRLPYGRELVGPEAAARIYFGRRPSDLSWGQATFLAIVPRAPSFLDPYRHPDRVRRRQHALLEQMVEAGSISPRDAARAAREPLALRPLAHAFEAPHFVQTLIAEGRLSPGSTTTTTLDLGLQRDVEGLIQTHLGGLEERSASNASVLVVDNASGDVLAWVGSADFENPDIHGQVDMVRSGRQPGSALKPFVYALAFGAGHTGADMLADVPTEFNEDGGHRYAPDNFHHDFSGPVSARSALATSLNIPAVRLAGELPEGRLLDVLRRLGMRSLNRPAAHYGLSLALGSGEVELRELAEAYATLARGGVHKALRVRIDTPPTSGTRVFDRSIAAAVTEALSDPLARAGLLSRRSPFDIGFPVALKTGTSSGYRDTWTVGYTAERTVAVWIGNADGQGTAQLTGATGAGPLFADVMRRAMRETPTRAPLWPEDALVSADVCPLSGKLPGPDCPHRVTRRFAPANRPSESCGLHRRVAPWRVGNERKGWTCTRRGSTVIAILPEDFARWLDGGISGEREFDSDGIPFVPQALVSGCGFASGPPELAIVSPPDGSVFFRRGDGGDAVELVARVHGLDPGRSVGTIDFVVDHRVVATAPADDPRVLIDLGPGDHDVYARPQDPGLAIELRGVRVSVR